MILESQSVPTKFRDVEGLYSFAIGEPRDFRGLVNGVPRYAIIVTNLEADTSANYLELRSPTGKLLDVIFAHHTKIYVTSGDVSVRGATTNTGAISGIVSEVEFDNSVFLALGTPPTTAAAAAALPGSAPATTGGAAPINSFSPSGFGSRQTQVQ